MYGSGASAQGDYSSDGGLLKDSGAAERIPQEDRNLSFFRGKQCDESFIPGRYLPLFDKEQTFQ